MMDYWGLVSSAGGLHWYAKDSDIESEIRKIMESLSCCFNFYNDRTMLLHEE